MSSLNFKQITLSTTEPIKLYRYIPIDRLFQNLKSDSDIFSMPFAWNDFDPFEDLLTKVVSQSNNGFNITEHLYAQCWNAGIECDGMWKNYTSKNLDDGVMIESDNITILISLIEQLSKSKMFQNNEVYQNQSEIENQITSMISIEKVKYLNHKEIVVRHENYFAELDKIVSDESIDGLNFLDSIGEGVRKILSIKREHYSYENEFRIFIQLFEKQLEEFNKVPINRILMPNFKSRVKQIVFSPKISYEKFQCFKSQLIRDYDFDENVISKSKMYDLDELLKDSKLKRKGRY